MSREELPRGASDRVIRILRLRHLHIDWVSVTQIFGSARREAESIIQTSY
jgi:hypothetical protein